MVQDPPIVVHVLTPGPAIHTHLLPLHPLRQVAVVQQAAVAAAAFGHRSTPGPGNCEHLSPVHPR